jgi:hypothetical protein
MSKIISPIYGEDYNAQWGKIDYNGKIVLDIGGSNGDTSSFFISKGAILSIAVDNNEDYIRQCKDSVKQLNLPILAITKGIYTKEDWEFIISVFKPDVVKSDIEGSEAPLFLINDDIFKLVPEYIIETHSDDIYNSFLNKCKECGYEIKDTNNWTVGIRIVYAKKT